MLTLGVSTNRDALLGFGSLLLDEYVRNRDEPCYVIVCSADVMLDNSPVDTRRGVLYEG